jgi:hypothetical protein
MSKKVTIPTDGGNPFVVMHNGIKYVYKPGADVDVPDGVALEIEEYKRWRKKHPCEVVPPFAGGGVQSVNGIFPDENGNVEISVSGGGAAASTVEPAEDDIPKVFFGGALQQTKDEAVVSFRYISKTEDISGYAEIKAQGNSSMSYPKKNQTVKLYKDAGCTEKLKVNFKGWGKQNKFCFKANWIDLSHARNVVSARLWADVVKSRANYAELPELLRTTPNQGAMDGFPIKVYADGIYQGRYTLNIPKDKWAFNMDDDLDEHCVLCGENYASGCFRAAANINESDWTDEIHDTVPASIKTRWNEVISFVMNSTDDEFKANLGNYFDVDSLIDYYLFGLASCGLDAFGKNQIYLTYNGQKWIASMYDMDSTWGLYWNGSSFVATDYARTSFEDMVSDRQGNLLYIRLEQLFGGRLKSRWAVLKNGALSIDNIINRFERFTDIASADLVKEDYASTTDGGKFTGIPSQSTNNIQQIRAYALARQKWTDEYVAALNGEIVPDEPDIPDVPDHTHNYTSEVTTEATCTKAGVKTYTCECGHTYTETIPAKGHTVVDGICSVCGAETVDYTLNPIAGLEWTANAKYDDTTGELITSAGDCCTPKFKLQNCAYQLTNGSGNSYVYLNVWDENGEFLGQGTVAGILARKEYTYAVSLYTTTGTESNFSIMPVDNSEHAYFELDMADLDWVKGGGNYAEADVTPIFTANVLDKVDSCDRFIAILGGTVKAGNTIFGDNYPELVFTKWGNYSYIAALEFATAEAAIAYFAENKVVLKFNERQK